MIKQVYNFEYLAQFCKENNIYLLKNYSKEKVTRDTIIEAKCKCDDCNEKCIKNFRAIVKSGSYCKKCAKIIRKIRVEKTNLKKRGVKHSLQDPEVREKGIQTNLQKRGVKHSLQDPEVREKGIQTNLQKRGVEYSSQDPATRIKFKQTCLDRYGCDNPSQNENIKQLKKETCLKNHGCSHPIQNEDIKQKVKQTCLDRYGVEHPSQDPATRIKFKQTCLDRYGCDNPSQNEDIQNKKINTNIQKFGYRHPSQNSEIMEKWSKNAYKLKNYILPSGNIIKIQGYENFALDELLQDGILEEDIINGCKNVPEIWYDDENGIKHRHYVDIFIPSENRCIEVKSSWTAEKKKDCIFLKQEAGKQFGYNYEIWVYNSKGEKVECYN
jgi:hypothetical protein